MNDMGLLDRLDDDASDADEATSIETAPAKEVKKSEAKKPSRRGRRAKAKEEAPVDDAEEDEAPRRRSRGRRERQPREKKERVVRKIGEDREVAGIAAFSFRRIVDFIVNYGWAIPILGLSLLGTNSDFTWFIIGGLALMLLNNIFLPYQFGRTLGNFTTRTMFIRHTGQPPMFMFFLMKTFYFPFLLLGLFGIQLALEYSKETNIAVLVICIVSLLIFLADTIISRVRKDDRMGLWETAFLGVWLTKHISTGESSGWLKRLESSGDFFEQRGWGVDGEGDEETDES
ncbi:MAG: hypothetical protein CMB82_00980 [Flammeovirgaceae bacterium]|nr:hypothetical protein [Flammeovirgaceae bacterium]